MQVGYYLYNHYININYYTINTKYLRPIFHHYIAVTTPATSNSIFLLTFAELIIIIIIYKVQALNIFLYIIQVR